MSEEKFRQLFENMTEGVAIHEMYYNDRGNAVDYRILSVNKSFEKHTGIPLFKATDMLASRLYGTNCAPYIREYENVTKTGIPAVFDTYFEKMQKHFHIGVISLGGPYFATIFEDITQHIKSGEKIIESERKYRSLYEYSQVGFFETDLDNAKIIMCNPRYCEMAGFSSVDEAIGHDILHLYVDPGARDEIKKIMRMQGYITNHVIKLRNRKTGKIFWGEFSARLGTNGNTAVGSIIDITDLKLAEEELRFKNEKLQTAMEELESINRELSSAMEELESANEELIKTNTRLVQHQREKDILLQEVHHRIKNNMNTISNLLFLQSEKLSDKSAAGALDDARIRIQSMMIIYDRLYRSSDYKNISIKMYLNNLIDEIFSVFPISEKINIEKQLEDFIMNSNSLFHIGIIVNEIITNSFKYAFPGQAKGVLIIRAFKIDDNTAEIAISDNGIGLYNPDYSRKKTGFGLDLIMMLAEQMNAMVELDGHNGTSFRIRFMLN
jgi:PAS domain S-box-containing protein